jgi:hypothetical protein
MSGWKVALPHSTPIANVRFTRSITYGSLQKGRERRSGMDTSTVRIVCMVAAVVLLAVIFLRRKKKEE